MLWHKQRTFISCISVKWVLPRPRPFRGQEVVLSLFICLVEMNVSTDFDEFLHLIITKVHIGPIFHKTHIFWTFWHLGSVATSSCTEAFSSKEERKKMNCSFYGKILPAVVSRISQLKYITTFLLLWQKDISTVDFTVMVGF